MASNARTRQAIDHSPAMVEIVPNIARDSAGILLFVISGATDLILFLLFADGCMGHDPPFSLGMNGPE